MKLPPYGKQLQARRDRGDHPWKVYLFFTPKWFPSDYFPDGFGLMVPPADYHPGLYDFSVLAGQPTHIIAHSQGLHDLNWFQDLAQFKDPSLSRPWMRLGIEVAAYAAPLHVHLVDYEPFVSYEFGELVYMARWACRDPETQRAHMLWPAGWSDQLNYDYQTKADRVIDRCIDIENKKKSA